MHALIRSIWPTLWALSWGAFTLDTVSEAVLKKFCYSSRPQWNELGKLTKVGTIKQRGPVSLDERFGSDIWSRLQGKTVLDYGCGYGVDVNSLTEHGINAVGLEHRQDLVEASPAVSKGEFVHSSQTGPLAGAFDCILQLVRALSGPAKRVGRHGPPAEAIRNSSHNLQPAMVTSLRRPLPRDDTTAMGAIAIPRESHCADAPAVLQRETGNLL
jgi:hypothetical protein